MMKRLLPILVFSAASLSAAWAPPATNQGWWTPGTAAGTPGVGVPGGIAQYLAGGVNDRAVTGNVIDVTQSPYSADNTGTTSVSSAVSAAWAAAVPGDVIYFPAGTYKYSSQAINTGYKDNITIRGESSALVTFVIDTTQSVFVWGSPGEPNGSNRTATGTKTKGTTTLTMSDTDPFAIGDHVNVVYENEVDATRIQAGAPPVWSSLGWPGSRKMYSKVTGKTSTTITIDPGLPGDATHLELTVNAYPFPLTGANWLTSGIGVENISVSFTSDNHPLAVFGVTAAEYCWFYDVRFLNWSMDTDNGSCISMGLAYRCEIRKCYFNSADDKSSDGAIGIGLLTSSLIYDNVFTGGFGTWLYDNGNSNNNVYAYNYAPGLSSIFHNAHPSLNLLEGNYAYMHQSDGYHGSSSDNTLYSNWYYGGGVNGSGWWSTILNRNKRRYALARNFFGQDGVNTGRVGFGFPNFNLNATGFSGPTGLSDQVGQADYSQPGYGIYEYIIQESDVFVGDFPADWEITGTLTTRTSDTIGVFTVSGGVWFTGSGGTGGQIWPRIFWNNKANWLGSIGGSDQGSVTNVAGNVVTISFASGTLPIQGTNVQMYTGPGGQQEKDLDVQPSTLMLHNYFANGAGTGAIQNSSEETFPASLVWSSKPPWVGTLDWPIFNVDSTSTADLVRLPAGFREINGDESYLGGTPPIAASGLAATAVSSSQISLAWSDNSDNESGFRIERRVGVGAWGTVTSVSAGTTTYSNTGLSPSTTYEYRVFAYNGAGDATASNTDSATTEAGGGEDGPSFTPSSSRAYKLLFRR